MICQADNCLFIHVPKVAGQSIESVFLERAGLTWQERESMLLKHNTDPKLGPPRLAHLTAQEYISLGYLSSEEFSNLFSFAFVRNPWERVVSEYLYREYSCSFKDFLFKEFPTADDDDYIMGRDLYRHVMPQAHFLCDQQGRLLVNFIGKYENLIEDFSKVTELITGQSLVLPHKNKSPKKWLQQLLNLTAKGKPHYSHYYDDECRNLVACMYQKDIEMFGYKFEYQ